MSRLTKPSLLLVASAILAGSTIAPANADTPEVAPAPAVNILEKIVPTASNLDASKEDIVVAKSKADAVITETGAEMAHSVKVKQAEEAKAEAERLQAEAKAKADEEARLKAEEEAKKAQEELDRLKAEEEAKAKAEEEARLAEEQAKAEAEAQASIEALEASLTTPATSEATDTTAGTFVASEVTASTAPTASSLATAGTTVNTVTPTATTAPTLSTAVSSGTTLRTTATSGSTDSTGYNVSKGETIAKAALSQIGVKQDCTALATNALRSVGINFHGWPVQYKSLGKQVSASEAKPGDIVVYDHNGMYWADGTKMQHVAIYIGNGKAVHGGWNGFDTQVFSVNLPTASQPIFIRVAS